MKQDRSLATNLPSLAKEWHPILNGDLTPSTVTVMSGRKVWWKCPKGDDHIWEAIIANRSKGSGCPICSNQKIAHSNSLGTANPELAREWHPTLNGDLTPFDVLPSTKQEIWWQCPTNSEHVWKARLNNRSNGKGCPFCSNQKIIPSNSLGEVNPQLASQWHPTLNGSLTPFDIAPSANRKVWWKCPNGDDHEWQATVNQRSTGTGCPKCNPVWSRAELRIYCELKTIFPSTEHRGVIKGNEIDILIPEISVGIEYDGVYWHQDKLDRDTEKNIAVKGSISLIRVREDGLSTLGENNIFVSRKSLKLSDLKAILIEITKITALSDSTSIAISNYLSSRTWLADSLYKKLYSERKSVKPEKSLEHLRPDLADEWHPTKNDGLTPSQFSVGAGKKAWWLGKCGHEWQDTINHRSAGRDCPQCRYKKASHTKRKKNNKNQLDLDI